MLYLIKFLFKIFLLFFILVAEHLKLFCLFFTGGFQLVLKLELGLICHFLDFFLKFRLYFSYFKIYLVAWMVFLVNVLLDPWVDLRHNSGHQSIGDLFSDRRRQMLRELLGHHVHGLVVLLHTVLHLGYHLLHLVCLHHTHVVLNVERLTEILLQTTDSHLHLQHLIILEFRFLLKGLQFPLDDVLYFQVQGHAVVVNWVQNYGVRYYVAVALVAAIDLSLHCFELLF